MSIQIEELCKRYGDKVLFEHLNLRVEKPAVLWAPSGWGKTTLLRILMGLEQPDGGRVTGVGRVGAVFQENRLCRALNAVQNVALVTPDGKGDPEAIRRRMRELMERRRASQPLELPSAGSTFKRPAGYYAGTLIDQCGLKGLTVGGAQVSEKHAGFVVNRGGATFADVTELIRQVRERVLARSGVALEPEVKIIPF